MKFAQDIVLAPVITENSMAGIADKKYTFKVATDATKIDIAKAVEELFDKNSQENIIDAYQLQLVTGKVLDKIREMADRLFAGEIAPSPVETPSGNACQWCDYATLCRAKDGPVRSYERKSNKQVLQELKGKKKP